MNSNRHFLAILMALGTLSVAPANAQDETRISSSIYLPLCQSADVTLAYDVAAQGKRFTPTWGLDQAWIWDRNLKAGINHMGLENVGIGRSAFRFDKALINDSVLTADMISKLRQRATIFDIVSPTLPIVLTADQEAGAADYFVKNKAANIEHWAAMINSHVHWMQENTQHPIIGVSPFNEGDCWRTEEGATPRRHWQVAKLLKENYPRFADIVIVGANTLNNDSALTWYTPGKQYYEWGNTHQLAGEFSTFAKFYEQLQKDGKVGYGDEMHNVGEAMIGLEYGMTVGIWWGFDSRARGEFCDISRHGERLAYGEQRDNWTAASVYRHDDGRVKAFIGSSERQAATTTYKFVSTDRDVYYDGYGPVREFRMEIPGGTGYQKGQTNAERVIDVTWGEDVAPCPITNGVYKLVNKATGNVAAASGSNIVQQRYTGTKQQQWNVTQVSPRIGGDYSFHEFTSVGNAKLRMNLVDFSPADGSNIMAYDKNDAPDINEQWYFVYAGDGYYYVRNRMSALYLTSATASTINGTNVVQKERQDDEKLRDRQLWRLLPIDADYDTVAPAQPQGLMAVANEASVALTWHANTESDLEGYMVVRCQKGTNEWNTIARKLTTLSFTDNTCRQGLTYIYKVKAIDRAQNLSDASETVEATPTGEHGLIGCWQLEDNFQDDTRNMMDGAFNGTPAFVADSKSGTKVLRLTGSANQYIQLPYEIANSDELTVAMWVKMRSTNSWERLFDFGYDTDHYMFLTPNNGSKMRFAIKNGGDEQTVDCSSKLPLQKWRHVAVTIGRDKTVVYIDGVEAGMSTGITIKPSDLCPVLNYIGRSQYKADPYLTADLDDVRIYNYAVSADEVQAIMGDGVLSDIAQPKAEQSQQQVYGVDGIRRDTAPKGVSIVSGKKILK